MKKILVLLAFLLFTSSNAYASDAGYQYPDSGLIYSYVTVPGDLPKAQYNQNEIVPFSQDAVNGKVDIKKLKEGKASTANILGLVSIGDAGIYKAAKNGQINTIHYVEHINEKVYIPIIFVPLYVKRHITIVYGE